MAEWEVGYCDCMLPGVLCTALWWKSIFCPCMVTADYVTKSQITKPGDAGPKNWDEVCQGHCLWCLIGQCAGAFVPCGVLLPIVFYTGPYRNALREKYGLREDGCCLGVVAGLGDYMSMIYPCGVAQNYLMAERRG